MRTSENVNRSISATSKRSCAAEMKSADKGGLQALVPSLRIQNTRVTIAQSAVPLLALRV